MVRKFFKQLSAERYSRALARLRIDNGLLAINRRAVSRAVLVGVFFALLPIPFQMVMVVMISFFMRFNVMVSLALVWLTNPLTMPFLFYVEYELGRFLLQHGRGVEMELSLEWIRNHYDQIFIPLYTGSLLLAGISAISLYFVVDRLWVQSVRQAYKNKRGL